MRVKSLESIAAEAIKVNETGSGKRKETRKLSLKIPAEFQKSKFPGRLYMRKLFVLAVFGLAFGIAQMASAAALVDVPSGHWAEDAVQRLVDSGLIEGYPDGTFKGDRPMTRYEYAMVVDRMMKKLDSIYCKKDECKGEAAVAAGGISQEELDELKDIVKKLAAEFKDELAALKVKVDENSAKIAAIEKEMSTPRIGAIAVSGSIRQRVDVPSTDMTNATFYPNFYSRVYDTAGLLAGGAASGVTAGYEMVPSLNFDGKAGDNAVFSIGLDKSLRTSPMGYDTISGDEAGELVINKAYVDIDFSSTVRELDLLKVKSGYQGFEFGPYGMLVDASGVRSVPAVRFDVAKDVVSLTGIGGLANVTGFGAIQGLGGSAKDPYAAVRLGLDLPWLDLGVNFLANGVESEKGWGADVVVPLLQNSPFLKQVKGEYMTVSDAQNGQAVGTAFGAAADDASFVIGLDVYKNKRAGLTLSYADLPAAVALTSMDGSPFTEYDGSCALGLDVGPNGVAAGRCFSAETGRMLFPAGFEGLGLEASYIIFGDVTLAGKGFIGNFAGGSLWGSDIDGRDYPGFGALSVSKPINDKSTFRVEYAQQGKDPILLNRVRGELLINF